MRHIVFPALRLVVWAVIAVALCVLAFGGGRSGRVEAGAPLQPTADLAQRTVAVAKGDIASTIKVTGTVAADPAVAVKSTAAGTVSRVRAKVGDAVQPGTPLLDVKVPLEPGEGTTVTAPDGTVTSIPPRTRSKTVTVTAGSAGTLATLTVLADQEVSVGADVATVSPGTLSVSAPLTQTQQFRLLTPPASASAQAPGGPAPFDCTHLSTGAAQGSSGPPVPDPNTGMMPEASTAQVTCRVPAGTTVFAGMSVDLTIQTGSASDVLVVPVSAVLGTIGEGTVWVPGPDGEPQERDVSLGLTDGQQVQVTEGLTEGEEILEFTPVPLDDPPGGPDQGGMVG
jgi:membrane fusion protein (multidrug efflux system)